LKKDFLEKRKSFFINIVCLLEKFCIFAKFLSCFKERVFNAQGWCPDFYHMMISEEAAKNNIFFNLKRHI